MLVKMWRARRVRLIPYMNNFLFTARSWKEVVQLRAQVLEDLAVLRWSTSWNKSQWKSSQCLEFLGFLVDTGKGEIRVKKERLEEIRDLGKRLVKERSRVHVRDMAAFAGKIMSVGRAVKPVCWFTRALYFLIDVTVFTGDAASIPWKIRKNFFRRCYLSQGAQEEILWWLENIHLWNGTKI